MRIVFFGLILFILTLTMSASAENFYVKLNGSGSQEGTSWGNAWSWSDFNNSSNWSATDKARKIDAGDTVYISGGSSGQMYNTTMNIYASGSRGNSITIRPGQDPGHNGVVSITSSSSHGINLNGKNYITIDGKYNGDRHIKLTQINKNGVYTSGGGIGLKLLYLEITNWANGGEYHGIYFNRSTRDIEIGYCKIYSPTFNRGVDAIKPYIDNDDAYNRKYGANSIHHCVIYDLPDDGIFVGYGFDIYNNFVDSQNPHERTYGHPDGIFNHMGVEYTRIYNNYIANFANDLMFFEGRERKNAHYKIYNNIWAYTYYYDHGWEAISIIACESAPGTINDVLIANNVFVDIYTRCLEIKNYILGGVISNITIKNNIMLNSGDSAVVALYHMGSGTYDNNILDNNIINVGDRGSDNINWEGTSYATVSSFDSAQGTTNYTTVPTFISYESYPDDESPPFTNDFHLDANDTAAKNQGVTIDDFSIDKDSISRPQGPAWDIGAYEYHKDGEDKEAPAPPENIKIL